MKKLKFQELALFPGDGRMGEDGTEGLVAARDDGDDVLAALQEFLEEAAAAASFAEQEQVHRAGRDQGDGGRGGKMQRPGEEEVIEEESP